MKFQRLPVKDRWTDEERVMLARKEVELTKLGVRFINQELLKFFDRTIESIKGQRKNPEHEAMVDQFLEEEEESANNSSNDSQELDSAGESGGSAQPVIDERTNHLVTLEPLDIPNYKVEQLNEICKMTASHTRQDVPVRVALYLKDILLEVDAERRTRRSGRPSDEKLNGKKTRRAEYARVQGLWKKHPSACVKRIVDDQLSQGEEVPQEVVALYWRAVFWRQRSVSPNLAESTVIHDNLWNPILGGEIKQAYPPNATAVGRDGLTVKQLKSIPRELLARVFSLFMWCGRLPEHLYFSRTVLIPKKKGAATPGDFRPITISSVLIRTYHKILANRLKASIQLDPRQRGFINAEGCSENVMLLDMALNHTIKDTGKCLCRFWIWLRHLTRCPFQL